MARKSERRKVGDRRASGRGKRVTKTVAKPKAKAAVPVPPPAPRIKFRGKLLENEPLARYTTWRIGGPARYLAMPADSEDVVRALELAQERGLPWIVLGLGSNVLFSDGGCSAGARRGRRSISRVAARRLPIPAAAPRRPGCSSTSAGSRASRSAGRRCRRSTRTTSSTRARRPRATCSRSSITFARRLPKRPVSHWSSSARSSAKLFRARVQLYRRGGDRRERHQDLAFLACDARGRDRRALQSWPERRRYAWDENR